MSARHRILKRVRHQLLNDEFHSDWPAKKWLGRIHRINTGLQPKKDQRTVLEGACDFYGKPCITFQEMWAFKNK